MVKEQRIVLGIETSAKLGRRLQKEHPEIANRCRKGEKRKDILRELCLIEEYRATPAVARAALGYALRGYAGYGKERRYAGFIDPEELRVLGFENRRRACKTIGIASALRRGQTPYTPEERERVYYYVSCEEYKHKDGSKKGHPDWAKIAEKLSKEFMRAITGWSAINAFRTYQRNLGEIVQASKNYLNKIEGVNLSAASSKASVIKNCDKPLQS